MKQINLIIEPAHKGYYITMSGHMPNPRFRNVISDNLETYGEAFSMASRFAHVIDLLTNPVKCYNHKDIEINAKEYCKYMAFQSFETFED